MNAHKILEWLNDNFEQVQELCEKHTQAFEKICNDFHVVFYSAIKSESFDNYRKEVLSNCNVSTGESYEDCNNILRGKLEKLWNLKWGIKSDASANRS